jgi:hypothetical protein
MKGAVMRHLYVKYQKLFSFVLKIKKIYSETSQNRPALGPKNMASLEGWPVL